MKNKNLRLLLILGLVLTIFTTGVYAQDKANIDILDLSGEETQDHESCEIEGASRYKSARNSEDAVYQEIKRGLENLQEDIRIDDRGMTMDEYKKIYIRVIKENPQIFYTNGAKVQYAKGRYMNYQPHYKEDRGLIRRKVDRLEKKIDEILDEIISDDMSDLHKELMIHDYIVSTTEYDRRVEEIDTMPMDSYNVYGLLVNGKAVCEGYAGAMKLLLDRVGIDSVIVSSKEMNHAWNIVTIDGENYHVDATYNDPIPDVSGRILYEFFNLSDEDMKETHVWNYEDYPQATSNKYSRLRNVKKRDYLGNDVYFLLKKEGRPSLYKLDLISKKKELVVDSLVDDFRIEGDMIYYLDRMTGKEEILETQPSLHGIQGFLPSHEIIPNSNWQMQVAGAATSNLISNPYNYRIRPVDARILGDKNIGLNAYNIEDNNFFKLRDLAAIFSGSEKGFEVNWNEEKKSIELISGQTYTGLGNEFEKVRGKDIRAVRNKARIYKDGKRLELEAYNIAGNNYFKLRDITELFNIGTDWDQETRSIILDSSRDYK